MDKNDARLMERRTLDIKGVELREANEGDGTELTGIAVPFNTRYSLFSDYAEVIDPDCDFGSRDVKISREHGELVGKVTGMSRENDGLHITAKLSDTASARETAQLVRDGVYDAFSIGFSPVENLMTESDDGVTEVHRRRIDLCEVAVCGTPAYPGAHITGQRTQTSNNQQPTEKEPEVDKEIEEKLDAITDEQRSMKTALAKGLNPEPARKLGAEYRSAGDYLLAVAHGDEEAAKLMHECRDMIVTKDTGNTTTWIADQLKLIEQRRKVTNLLTHDSLPAKGMTMEYNIVTSDTMDAGEQETEGDDLKFGKITFGTKSVGIHTYGGWTKLSRQTIERSTTPMLNTALKALNNAYAKNTENAVRKYLYDTIATQRDATSDSNRIEAPAAVDDMTIKQWVDLIIDAAELADDLNVNLTRLGVSKDVMSALVNLKDTGDRFFDLSGSGTDKLGDFDLTGIAGRFLRVPVQMLPKAPAGTACFIDPESVTVWEAGGPTQLTDGDPTTLTNSYSVYGYMAMAATHAEGLIPIKFAGDAA